MRLTQSCCCGYNTHKSWPLLDWSISGASEASIKEMKMQGVLIKLMWFKKLHNSVILTPLLYAMEDLWKRHSAYKGNLLTPLSSPCCVCGNYLL